MNTVFVYGSLKKNFHNHVLLKGSKFLGTAKSEASRFKMLDLGSFPGLVFGNEQVKGELYKVDDDTMAALDRLEGHPSFYKRLVFNFVDEQDVVVPAWVYILQDDYSSSTTVEDCNWLYNY